jgi:hypothetical protein
MGKTEQTRLAAAKRRTRITGRRQATRQIWRGDFDAMATGERMVRRTPRQSGE